MGNQLWLSRAITPSAAAANYWPPNGGPNYESTLETTEANVSAVVSADGGTLKRMRVRLSAAPGAGKSRQVRVMVGGVASTVLTLTISDAETTGTVVGNVVLAAGTTVSIESTPSGTPAASDVFVTLEYQPDTANYFLYPQNWGYGVLVGSASAVHTSALVNGFSTTNATGMASVSPLAGTIREVYIECTVAPGAAKSRAFEIFVAGVSVATYTIANTDTISDNSGLSLAITAGQRITIRETPTGTPTNTRVRVGLVLEPTTAGTFAMGFSGQIAISDVGDGTFLQPVGATGNTTTPIDATEADVQMPLEACTLTALYLSTSTSVNTGSEVLTMTARRNASSTTLAATLNATDTVLDSGTGTEAYVAGDLLSLLVNSTLGDLGSWSVGLAAIMTTASGGKGSGGKGKGGNTPGPGEPPKKPLRTSLSKSWKWDRGWR
jgi:hypothetical protein